jgi:hypothetical protein
MQYLLGGYRFFFDYMDASPKPLSAGVGLSEGQAGKLGVLWCRSKLSRSCSEVLPPVVDHHMEQHRRREAR